MCTFTPVPPPAVIAQSNISCIIHVHMYIIMYTHTNVHNMYVTLSHFTSKAQTVVHTYLTNVPQLAVVHIAVVYN